MRSVVRLIAFILVLAGVHTVLAEPPPVSQWPVDTVTFGGNAPSWPGSALALKPGTVYVMSKPWGGQYNKGGYYLGAKDCPPGWEPRIVSHVPRLSYPQNMFSLGNYGRNLTVENVRLDLGSLSSNMNGFAIRGYGTRFRNVRGHGGDTIFMHREDGTRLTEYYDCGDDGRFLGCCWFLGMNSSYTTRHEDVHLDSCTSSSGSAADNITHGIGHTFRAENATGWARNCIFDARKAGSTSSAGFRIQSTSDFTLSDSFVGNGRGREGPINIRTWDTLTLRHFTSSNNVYYGPISITPGAIGVMHTADRFTVENAYTIDANEPNNGTGKARPTGTFWNCHTDADNATGIVLGAINRAAWNTTGSTVTNPRKAWVNHPWP